MFAGLKNKIKEETGSDVSLIPAIVNSNQPKLRGRHSRQGSTTSLGSFTIDGTKEDGGNGIMDIKLADGKVVTPKEFKKLESKEEEWRKKLQKKEDEFTVRLKKAEEAWKKQLEEKEKELKKELDKKDQEKKGLEEERDELKLKNTRLEESAKKAADYQKRVCQYQEDIDQLEGFQTQEMAKIKHLLLVKEQELAEKERLLKDNNSQMEGLRVEVVKLRKFEQEYENIKESATQNALSSEKKLKEKEEELASEKLKLKELESSLNKEKNNSNLFQLEINKLKDAYETEKKISSEINDALQKERREKDDMMMRNAQISQEFELARQELREQELETTELQSRVGDLEYKIIEREKDLDLANIDKVELNNRIKDLEKFEKEKEQASSMEKELKAKINQLENELFDKNKSIKMLQQRLTDMKKTLQRELKVPVNTIDPGGTDSDGFIPAYAPCTSSGSNMAVLTPSSSQQLHVTPKYRTEVEEEMNDDVNFKYLKHVLIKFLTSREYEAQHLTRAVATLLRFSAEEERLLKETLEWKMSWFGTRPNLGNGQTAKTIPPS